VNIKAFEATSLVKVYPGFQLGPLDLDLEPGMVLGCVGPNASGKTTTMHCLMNIVRSNCGEVRIYGRTNDLSDPEWRQDVGYVGDAHLFYENWSGAENLRFLSCFFSAWSESRAAELIRRFHLPLDGKVKHLSSGNRVKLALVSVLARSPRLLLLLDEPTAGLDPVVRSEVLDILFEILESGESSIFYSTHILTDISRLADELAFLDEGKLVERCAVEDLTARWRRISFRFRTGAPPDAPGVKALFSEGDSHRVVTGDWEQTLAKLKIDGAEQIEVNRMTIEEIAVQIMKSNN